MRYLLNRRIFESIVETENLVSNILGDLPEGFFYRVKYSSNKTNRNLAKSLDEHSDILVTICKMDSESGKIWSVDKKEVKSRCYKSYRYSEVKSTIDNLVKGLQNYRIVDYTGYKNNYSTYTAQELSDSFLSNDYIKISIELRLNNLPSFKGKSKYLVDGDIESEVRDIFLDVFDFWESSLNIKESGGYYKLVSINSGSPYSIGIMDSEVKSNLIESLFRCEGVLDSNLINFEFQYHDYGNVTEGRNSTIRNKVFNNPDIGKNKDLAINFIRNNDIIGFSAIYKKSDINESKKLKLSSLSEHKLSSEDIREILDLFYTELGDEGFTITNKDLLNNPSYSPEENEITYQMSTDVLDDQGKNEYNSTYRPKRNWDGTDNKREIRDKYFKYYQQIIFNVNLGHFRDSDLIRIKGICSDLWNRLVSLGYNCQVWEPGYKKVRIHISTDESNPFMDSKNSILLESHIIKENLKEDITNNINDILVDNIGLKITLQVQKDGNIVVYIFPAGQYSESYKLVDVKDDVNRVVNYVNSEGYKLDTARYMVFDGRVNWFKMYDSSPNRWGVVPTHSDIFDVQDLDLTTRFDSIELKFSLI
jgi:hypothetical protein